MASVNPLSKELVLKIVYYGPGLGGKTTTLEYLHQTAKPEHRGKLVSLATPVDRTLYFDFLPLRVPTQTDLNIRLQLFTVPGQVYFNATRKLVLTGADGVVFVADAQALRADANIESVENLRQNLLEQGRELSRIPLVYQYNKQDLPDLTPQEELETQLNPYGAPSFPTCAVRGDGVFEALDAICHLVLEDFETARPSLRPPAALEPAEGGLTAAIRQASDSLPPSPLASPAASSVPPPPAEVPPEPTAEEETSDQPADISATLLAAPPPPRDLQPPATTTKLSATSERPGQPARAGGPTSAPEHISVVELDDAELERELAGATSDVPEIVPPNDGGLELRLDVSEELSEAPRDLSAPAPSEATPTLPRAPAPASHASFQTLWPPNQRHLIADIENALTDGDYALVAERCDSVVSRTFASAAGLLGSSEAPRDVATAVLLLGLDGRQYLWFRAVLRRARAGERIDHAEALEAYVFVINARLARLRISGS